MLERVKNDLADISVVESAPGKLEGRQAVMAVSYTHLILAIIYRPYFAWVLICLIALSTAAALWRVSSASI